MWHYFNALPSGAKIIALIGVVSLAAWGALKHKAIAAFSGALKDAISERFWGFVRRKLQSGAAEHPDLKLVAGIPSKCRWYIGAIAQTPVMAVQVPMNFAHKADGLSIIIKRAYLKDTQEAAPTVPIVVDGPYCPEETIHMMLTPIIAKPGKKLRSRVVFVDQFNCKHVSEQLVFNPHPMPIQSRPQPLTCFFCGKPILPDDLAHESYVSAHTKCIWKA